MKRVAEKTHQRVRMNNAPWRVWSVCALIVFCCCPRLVAAPKFYKVDLSGDRSLKPLFDAGLRPKMVPGINDKYEVRDQVISFRIFPD